MFEPFSEKYGARGYSRSLYMYDPEDNKIELKLLSAKREA
jgi:extradiol dioxygenase family protein